MRRSGLWAELPGIGLESPAAFCLHTAGSPSGELPPEGLGSGDGCWGAGMGAGGRITVLSFNGLPSMDTLRVATLDRWWSILDTGVVSGLDRSILGTGLFEALVAGVDSGDVLRGFRHAEADVSL